MKKLSRANYKKAVAFIHTQARELDKRLFAYHFEGGTKTAVLNALAHYQNDDGGFGHGIEPDFRLQASSPMATSVGLQYCVAVDAAADHPIVQKAIRYLMDTYDTEHDYWPATYENVNDEPHAFWWHVDKLEPPDETGWANPSAELVGYLWRYGKLVPSRFLERITARARANLESSPIISGDAPQKYNILCWERAAASLPESLGTASSTSLRASVTVAIRRTFAAYESIRLDTFQELSLMHFIHAPDTLLAQMAPDVARQALDNEIANQTEDGSWQPGWHWGQFEDVWPIAKQEWAGKITAETLLTLWRFDRIEGVKREE